MARPRITAFLLDLACVVAFALMGTLTHDSGAGRTAGVAAPFVVALALAHLSPLTARGPVKPMPRVWVVCGYTVVMGMVIRRFVADEGTAPVFVIVTAVFLASTMLAWRSVLGARRGTPA